MSDEMPENAQLFYTIAVLDEAIERKRKVRFHYLGYRTDKQVHWNCHEDSGVGEYAVSPYQMAAKQGKYCLICNYDRLTSM